MCTAKNTCHVKKIFYRCGKVTTHKSLHVSKMPHIFMLHCKGAGYVVPSKELKIGDVSFHLHVFIVHTSNI